MAASAQAKLHDVATLAERLRRRAHRAARAHFLAGKSAAQRNIQLGAPVVILSSAVGSATFATLATKPGLPWIIATGAVSFAAATLAALQTFFRFSEQAQEHKRSGAEYAALKRDLDLFMIICRDQNLVARDLHEALTQMTSRFNELERSSPDVADHLYDQAKQEQGEDREGI